MNRIRGDLVALALGGKFKIIAHGANCFCTMGAGIAKAIKETFPQAYRSDLETKRGDFSKFGSLSHARIPINSGELIVVNLYTQFNLGRPTKEETFGDRLEAIRSSLLKLKTMFPKEIDSLGLPMIGAGLAGGDWAKIEPVIDSVLPSSTIVEYTPSNGNNLPLWHSLHGKPKYKN